MTKQSQQLTIRRAIVRLQPDQSTAIPAPADEVASIKAYAEKFARARKIGITATVTAEGVTLTRTANLSSSSRFGVIETLEVGKSILLPNPPAEHAYIRRVASGLNAKGDRFFRCTREGDEIRVTRMPVSEAERQQCGAIDTFERKTKYDLDRLAHVDELTFNLPRAEHQNLRVAAARAAAKNGWPLKCSIQPDGSMRVIRADKLTEDSAPAGPIAAPKRQTKYGLDRLSTEPRLTFTLPRADHSKLRMAVSSFSAKTGWVIRCRLQDDGTLLVYRTDAPAPGPTPTPITD